MPDRLFFALQRGPGRAPQPVLYRDELRPSAFAMAITDYACEVPPALHGWSLDRLHDEYLRLHETGRLPANLVRR